MGNIIEITPTNKEEQSSYARNAMREMLGVTTNDATPIKFNFTEIEL